MEIIRNPDGSVHSQSRNLRGIRRYVSNHLIKVLDITELSNGEGQLSILFDSGHSFQTNFACWSVLCRFVRDWRNVRGAPLRLNGEEMGALEPSKIPQ